ncbi:MAG: hypothetical protein AMXMBFR47_03600 [Planctomycetota bacterium]
MLRSFICVLILLIPGLTGCPRDDEPAGQTGIPAFSQKLRLELVAGELSTPVALVFPDDGTGRGFVASQTGRISVVNADGSVNPTPLLDLNDRVVSLSAVYDERGLLGLALHPQFNENGRFFVFYNGAATDAVEAGSNSEVRIAEYSISAGDPNIADAGSERVLLRIGKPQGNHNGGQLAFGPDGYLYASVGDGGGANDRGSGHSEPAGNAQDLSTLLGKILRLDVDGGDPYAIPPDNPFVGVEGARGEIWAYGFRNVWRFSFDVNTNRLYAGDVGQGAREEMNIVTRGGNFGWRVLEGTTCLSPESAGATGECPATGLRGDPLIPPIFEYGHDEGNSIVGGFVYRAVNIPNLTGYLVFGDWAGGSSGLGGRLFAAGETIEGLWDIEELLFENGNADGRVGRNILSLAVDAQGEFYLLTSESSRPGGTTGQIWRLGRGSPVSNRP